MAIFEAMLKAKQKLLITGASGFIGYHLVRKAHADGFEVHAAVRKSSQIDQIKAFVDQFIEIDYENDEYLSKLFQQNCYDFVIHASAMTRSKSVEVLRKVNIDYTMNLLNAAFSSEIPPKQFVFVSSLAAIGPISYDDQKPIREDSPYRPLTQYGESKRDVEKLIRERYSRYPVTVFRPTAVYGPNERDLFILIQTLSKGIDAYIGRDPQQLSFVYVKDLVDAIFLALDKKSDMLGFYNVSDGRVYDRYAFAALIKEITGKKMSRVFLPKSLVAQFAKFSSWIYRRSKKSR